MVRVHTSTLVKAKGFLQHCLDSEVKPPAATSPQKQMSALIAGDEDPAQLSRVLLTYLPPQTDSLLDFFTSCCNPIFLSFLVVITTAN